MTINNVDFFANQKLGSSKAKDEWEQLKKSIVDSIINSNPSQLKLLAGKFGGHDDFVKKIKETFSEDTAYSLIDISKFYI